MDTIGKRIEAIAERKGLPIGSELAARLGVKYESLRKWRQGLAGPSRRRQEVISSVLGVPASEFMFGDPQHGAAAALTSQESRLLKSFRKLLADDKADTLQRAERRAREIEEIELRVRTERGAYQPPRGASRKPPKMAA